MNVGGTHSQSTASSVTTSCKSDSQNDLPGFKLQILGFDSYQSIPTSLDKKLSTINGRIHKLSKTELFTVPVLRVYGKLPSGHTCLCHIHDVFPYIYIRYIGKVINSTLSESLIQQLISKELIKLKDEINFRLSESFTQSNKRKAKGQKRKSKRVNIADANKADAESLKDANEDFDSDDQDNDLNDSMDSYVADISLVKGIPFYGYHLGYSPFVKISLTNPSCVTRLTKLLHSGKIFGKFIQPFESHVPYTLQFLTDYNAFSMDWLRLSKLFWRYPLVHTKLEADPLNASFQPFFNTNFTDFNQYKINDDLKAVISTSLNLQATTVNILKPNKFNRISRTMVEFDTSAKWILNRHSLAERDIHSSLFENSATLEKCVGYFDSTRTLLNDVAFLRKSRNLPPTHKFRLFEKIKRSFTKQEWFENAELKKAFENCLNKSMEHFAETDTENMKILDKANAKFKWLEHFQTSFNVIDSLHINLEETSVYKGDLITVDASYYLKRDDPNWLVNQILSLDLSDLRHIPDNMPNVHNEFHDNFSRTRNVREEEEEEEEEEVEEEEEEEKVLDQQEQDQFLGEIPHFTNERKSIEEGSQAEVTSFIEEINEVDYVDGIESVKHNLSKSLHDSSINDIEDKFEDVANIHQSDFQIFAATQKQIISETSYNSTLIKTNEDVKRFAFRQHFEDFHPLENVFFYTADSSHKKPIFSSHKDFMDSFETKCQRLKVEYRDPYYSKLSNYDAEPFYYAGKKYLLECSEIEGSSNNLDIGLNPVDYEEDYQKRQWIYLPRPPQYDAVKSWITSNKETRPENFNLGVFDSQVKGVTQRVKGFKFPSMQTPTERKKSKFRNMLMLTMEIQVTSRENLLPDPNLDEVKAIFWTYNSNSFFFTDSTDVASGAFVNSSRVGLFEKINSRNDFDIQRFDSEIEMAQALISLVEFLDPDILAGFEVNESSWGYIIKRFRKIHNIDLLQRLSRTIFKNRGKVKDSYGYRHGSGVRVIGRHMLNIWRQFRKEVNLGHYSLENIVFHLLHKRIPVFSAKILNKWWNQDDKHVTLALKYWLHRVQLESELVFSLEIIEKITEQCKLLGCDFYSVIYRGSQYMVECLLIRLAKEENFILLSPSKDQVFAQDALECIPLVMEPESGFYKSPLVVLDFQSLYPSLIIAYNICYSTFLGRMKDFSPDKYSKAGVTNYKLNSPILNLLKDHINITPNGMMFAKSKVRQSLLSKMLIELLDARIIVKGTMNILKDDFELTKLYDNRQLGLKLIANVTYGYTSASYSGRMPNSDVADAIVSCGRETLLKAVKEIENHSEWGAKVIYGDTDSLFIYLPGKTKSDAFRIGQEMSKHVTSINPSPIKLKFEKVYHPSFLLSKKRYIGWSYEQLDQIKPKFDAKGIETVRRDGIPAQAKILEKSLTLLFESRDISKIKDYILSEFVKITKGKVNWQDFLFSKEVRLGTYKNEAYLPPGARVSLKKMNSDKRAKPQYRERVFYLVRKGAKNEILRDRCLSPEEFLSTPDIELDSEYYIQKVLIPPLERIFMLVGVDIRRWVLELPKKLEFRGVKNMKFQSVRCMLCGKKCEIGHKICDSCKHDELGVITKSIGTLHEKQDRMNKVLMFCRECTRSNLSSADTVSALECQNEDCSVFYDKYKRKAELNDICHKLELANDW